MLNVKQFIEVDRKEPKKHSANQRRTDFNEIYDAFSLNEVKQQADRCLDCGNPYCQNACPVHNYIPNWLQLVAEGRFLEAADISNQTNSLPEVCGRVCPQDRLCEMACTLENTNFEAVTIGAIEKFITDYAFENGYSPIKSDVKIDKKVAIIGAGPAGMACANVLSRSGVMVDVYDSNREIGGLLTFGIPNFKLDKSIVKKRRKQLEDQGVKFILNTTIGNKPGEVPFDSIRDSADAVFLGLGVYGALDGNLKGSNAAGVYKALDFLIGQINDLLAFKDLKSNEKKIDLKGKKVIVLGGGDTAMDCNRTAIRQGASQVICAYRRDEASMPGSKKEVSNAVEEGVEFFYNAQPLQIISQNNQVVGVEFAKTKLVKNESSERSEFQITDEKFILNADAIIIAFGFQAQKHAWFTEHKIMTSTKNLTNVKGVSDLAMQSSNPDIFTGGDMYRGSALVVEAIDDGQQAAKSILTYLGV